MRRVRIAAAFAAFAFLSATATAQPANASHWWTDSSGQAVHLNLGHIPGISFYNNAVNSTVRQQLEDSRGLWSTSPAFDLYNWSSQSANVVAWDGNWTASDWSGLATPYGCCFWANGHGGHATQMGVQINLRYLSSGWQHIKAVACQELGHATGAILHAGNGCMGYTYFHWDPSVAAARQPNAHDWEHPAFLWQNVH